MNPFERIRRKLLDRGWYGLAEVIASRLRRKWRMYLSPVPWARLGIISRLIGRTVAPAPPPILIMSYPRSGSSWVGEVLGNARNAMYLREPITQTYLTSVKDAHSVVFEVDKRTAHPVYASAAEKAFRAMPGFPGSILLHPRQWRLRRRLTSKLVVKEVNPMALSWFLKEYRPKVIFLVRHPAAVAASFRNRGWIQGDIGELHGLQQAQALQCALQAMSGYEASVIIKYEDLCESPVECFRRLFRFAGLAWGPEIEELIRTKSSGAISSNPYDTARYSKGMIDSWRGKLSDMELENLGRAYKQYKIPWYGARADWINH